MSFLDPFAVGLHYQIEQLAAESAQAMAAALFGQGPPAAGADNKTVVVEFEAAEEFAWIASEFDMCSATVLLVQIVVVRPGWEAMDAEEDAEV